MYAPIPSRVRITAPQVTMPVSVDGTTAIIRMAVVSVMVVMLFIVLVVLWLVAVTGINI